MATTTKNNTVFGQICSIANKIKKERGSTQKEAFAIAKAMLAEKEQNPEKSEKTILDELVERMATTFVKFTYTNKAGKEETTVGTMNPELVSKTYVPQGRKTSKSDDTVVFWDRYHGQYRPLKKDKLLKVF